jgi:hypothetical protein
MSQKNKWRLCINVSFLCLTLAGCASISPGPFKQFNDAVSEAGAGIDAAMLINYKWTRSGYISEFSADTASKFSELIVRPGENYSWSMTNKPLYFEIKKARSALLGLNLAFSRYASLMLKLSSGELTKENTFDLMANDLNKNFGEALQALDDAPSAAAASPTALLSTAFIEAAKLYIEHKRRTYLIEAIEKNQENIQKYSDLCITLIHTMTVNLKTYYADNTESVKKAWNSEIGEKRRKQTAAMLDLNDRFIDALGMLRFLEATYKAFPAAHADLLKAISKTKANSEGIQQLFSSGQHLQILYNELMKN